MNITATKHRDFFVECEQMSHFEMKYRHIETLAAYSCNANRAFVEDHAIDVQNWDPRVAPPPLRLLISPGRPL